MEITTTPTFRRMFHLAALAILLCVCWGSQAHAQSVVVMVNGDPITSLDVEQRMKLIQISTHKTPSRQQVISDLIDEKLEIKEAKTKLYRAALDKLDAKRTALLVENGKTLTNNLLLGARNLKGVELVLNNEVHPYDLLRYERAIFSKAAIEQLSEVLAKTASKRKAAQKEAA